MSKKIKEFSVTVRVKINEHFLSELEPPAYDWTSEFGESDDYFDTAEEAEEAARDHFR